VSRFGFDEATDVLLARDDLFADSLASGTLQGALDGPLLLTPGRDLDDDVASELERLGAQRLHVLGGPDPVSDTVTAELVALRYLVDRIAGASRTETAIAAAQTLLTTPTRAVVARAYPGPGDPTAAFADALAAGAYGAATETPVLLTATDRLTTTTSEYLETSPIEVVYVAGGVDAVSDQVVADIRRLGITVERIDGADRTETAVGFAELQGMETAEDASAVVLAEGFDPLAWAPGFAAASLAGDGDVALVLSDDQSLPTPTSDFLDGGGAAALVCAPLVTEEACTAAEDALAG
jgi:putative cell wall-binding protein